MQLMLDRHASIAQPARPGRPPMSSASGRRRATWAWVLGALVPGVVFASLEIAFANNSPDDGWIATTYVFYLVGFAFFSALRVVFDPITVLIFATVAFLLGLPFGVAMSLGIFATAPTLFAIGGIVVSLGFGLRKRSPSILA